MVGDSTYRKCPESGSLNVAFSQPRGLLFKGLGQKIPVYEIISFINFEIMSTMPEFFRDGLLEKMQYAVTQPMAEPWIFITLLREYISLISSGQYDYKARILDAKGKLDLARKTYEEILLHNPTQSEAHKKVEQYSAQ
jgi:hypothetical protein